MHAGHVRQVVAESAAALETARRALVTAIRTYEKIRSDDLESLERALADVNTLFFGLCRVMGYPVGEGLERKGFGDQGQSYVRVLAKAMDSFRAGDVPGALRRAGLALWAAHADGEDAVRVTAFIIDLLSASVRD